MCEAPNGATQLIKDRSVDMLTRRRFTYRYRLVIGLRKSLNWRVVGLDWVAVTSGNWRVNASDFLASGYFTSQAMAAATSPVHLSMWT